MIGPPPAGYHVPPPQRTRTSRAGGIVLAVAGVLTLISVFALPFERFGPQSNTLADIRRLVAASPFLSGLDSVTYQLLFFIPLAAGILALLPGVMAAAIGSRAVNVVALLAALLASFLAFVTPFYYFFRWPIWFDDLDYLFTDVAGAGFYAMFLISFLLLAGAIIAFVGAIRAGSIRRSR